MVQGGRASGILSIRGPEASWGRLGSIVDTRKRLHRMRPGSRHNRPILSARHRARAQVPKDSSVNVVGGAFREARGYVPGPLL